MMKNSFGDGGILDAIGSLSAQGATGRMHISTGMTDGALAFNRGQLVEARMGKLTGFQAINALVSVPDATYNFDPTFQPPPQSSITAKERLLLKDFFGIEAAAPVEPEPVAGWPDDDVVPEPVVPLSEVPEYDDEATVVRTENTDAERRPHRYARPPITRSPITRSVFRPALLLIVLAVFATVAAAILFYRFRKPEATTAALPTVQTSAPADVPPQPTNNETTSATPDRTANVPNLTGNWNVVNTVEQTSYGAYRNMQIGFNVSINQSGKDFTGTGQKISENGQSLPADSRTPILVRGTIDGDKVEATFSETGTMRKTNGRFVWRIDKTSGGLIGTFVSSAARSRGKSAAKKGS